MSSAPPAMRSGGAIACRRRSGRTRSLPRCGRAIPSLGAVRLALGEDVGELLHVVACDLDVAALVLVAQAVDELGSQDVDLSVQDAPPVRDLGLLVGQLL